MDGGVSLCKPVALEHVEQRGLARVIQPQEHDVGTLLEETHPLEGTPEEVKHKHIFELY